MIHVVWSVPFTHYGDSGLKAAWLAFILTFLAVCFADAREDMVTATYGHFPLFLSIGAIAVIWSDNNLVASNTAPSFVVNTVGFITFDALAAFAFGAAWIVMWSRRLPSLLVRLHRASFLAFFATLASILATNLWLYADWKAHYQVFTAIVEVALRLSLLTCGLFAALTVVFWMPGRRAKVRQNQARW